MNANFSISSWTSSFAFFIWHRIVDSGFLSRRLYRINTSLLPRQCSPLPLCLWLFYSWVFPSWTCQPFFTSNQSQFILIINQATYSGVTFCADEDNYALTKLSGPRSALCNISQQAPCMSLFCLYLLYSHSIKSNLAFLLHFARPSTSSFPYIHTRSSNKFIYDH